MSRNPTSSSTTLTPEVVRAVHDRVLDTFIQAEEIYRRPFVLPEIVFSLRGECAGRAWCTKNRIQLNPILLTENVDDFIAATVPHEVAHILNWTMNGQAVRPHGSEWRGIMSDLGVPARRCHNYDTTNARARRPWLQRRHEYSCACTLHSLTQTIHNRISRGWGYRCRRCGGRLKPCRIRTIAH